MRKINTFTFVSVDGFYAGPHDEIDWFKAIKKDDEYDAFTHRQSRSGGVLIFGHTTYEMMKSYWPTPVAIQSDPAMADVVNHTPKVVFSKTLQIVEDEPEWDHIKLLHDIQSKEIIKLKEQDGNDVTILGSGSIVRQLASMRLIDEYQLLIVPVILGAGKYLFENVEAMELNLLEARYFKNGIVWLRYQQIR